MAKNRTRSRSNKRSTTSNLYWQGNIIGLVISDTTDDVITKNDPLETTPTILFYSSSSKVVLDYSHASDEDLEILRVFFEGMSKNDTFTIDSSTADFIKERGTKVEADLSGSFTLDKFSGDTVTATVSSVTNKDSSVETYESKYFTTVPKLSKTTSSVKSEALFQFRNQSGPNSIHSFRDARPIMLGDFLEVETPLNAGKFRVVEYKIESGVEIITVDPQGQKTVEEDLIGTVTPVRLYRVGYEESSLSLPQKTRLKEVRESYNSKDTLRGTCCLYLKDNQRIEDYETGHVFTTGDVYECGCKDDWECIFLADKLNRDHVFTFQNNNFCQDRTDSSCNGYASFPDSPDDDSNERCACCPTRSALRTLPDERASVENADSATPTAVPITDQSDAAITTTIAITTQPASSFVPANLRNAKLNETGGIQPVRVSKSAKQSVDAKIREIESARQRIELLQNEINQGVGIPTGPIAVDGYYPLYTTIEAAVAASPTPYLIRQGESTAGYHVHVLRGREYYMPNGLVMNETQFHGDYSIEFRSGGGLGTRPDESERDVADPPDTSGFDIYEPPVIAVKTPAIGVPVDDLLDTRLNTCCVGRDYACLLDCIKFVESGGEEDQCNSHSTDCRTCCDTDQFQTQMDHP